MSPLVIKSLYFHQQCMGYAIKHLRGQLFAFSDTLLLQIYVLFSIKKLTLFIYLWLKLDIYLYVADFLMFTYKK